jgi:hypothetical protein
LLSISIYLIGVRDELEIEPTGRDAASIRFQLPGNLKVTRKFNKYSELIVVDDFLLMYLTGIYYINIYHIFIIIFIIIIIIISYKDIKSECVNWTINIKFPKQCLSVMSRTIEELGLHPRAMLIIYDTDHPEIKRSTISNNDIENIMLGETSASCDDNSFNSDIITNNNNNIEGIIDDKDDNSINSNNLMNLVVEDDNINDNSSEDGSSNKDENNEIQPLNNNNNTSDVKLNQNDKFDDKENKEDKKYFDEKYNENKSDSKSELSFEALNINEDKQSKNIDNLKVIDRLSNVSELSEDKV